MGELSRALWGNLARGATDDQVVRSICRRAAVKYDFSVFWRNERRIERACRNMCARRYTIKHFTGAEARQRRMQVQP